MVVGLQDQLNKETTMKVGRNKIHTLLILFCAVQACAQPNEKFEKYNEYLKQEMTYRDSLYILFTVKEWGKVIWDSWGVRTDIYNMSYEDVEYYVGGTFYSPDSTKIIVWIGTKEPNSATLEKYSADEESNKMCPNGNDTVYSLSAVIGTRSTIHDVWEIYPFDKQQAVCCSSKEESINILGRYYFKEMKSIKMYRIMQTGERMGHKELEAYGYNLQDKDFWKNCWLFEIDTVGSHNLYPFQINGYYYYGEKCSKDCAVPYNPPKIIYPKEILDLFKSN